MGGGIGDHIRKIRFREEHHRPRVVLHGLDRIHDDRVVVSVDHGQDVQSADGLLAAVHVLESHGLYPLGHPESDRIIAHYGASEAHDNNPWGSAHLIGR